MILASREDIRKYTELGVWGEKTLIDCFREHAVKDPDKVCMVDPPNKKDLLGMEPERPTYGRFHGAVDAVASALVASGIGKDDVIMVQLPNCWELAMLYLAITRAGALISPAPVLWREAELGYIADITGAKCLITVNELNGFGHRDMGEKIMAASPAMENVLGYEEIREMMTVPASTALDGIRVDANDIFSLCWTSGTEARPKGCPMSHNNWMGAALIQETTGMKAGDTMLTAGPLVNMAAVGTVFAPWMVMGGTLVLHHPFDPQGFMMQIMQEKPNYTLMVPALANMIAKHELVDHFDLSSFRTITMGSAAPSLWTMQEFKRRWDVDIGNIWGQNEGTGIVAGVSEIPEMERRADHFPQWGKPGSNWSSRSSRVTEVKIIDAAGEALTRVGDVGELVYRGPGVIASYYKDPEMTAKSFTPDGFFKSGDLFQIREGDCISFYERSKDIIIRGGYNISSQEVENYLLSHPGVLEAVVVGMPDEKLGERMCVYVIPREGESITLQDLISVLEKKGVAKYKHPERLEVVDAIPRNPVGKVLKNKLRQDIKRKLTGG